MNDINTRGTAETSCPSNDIGSIPDEKDEMKTEKTDPPKSTSSKMFEIRMNGLCFYLDCTLFLVNYHYFNFSI